MYDSDDDKKYKHNGYADLKKLIKAVNVAEDMEADDRYEIAVRVCRGYDIDEDSRHKWLKMNESAMQIINFEEMNDERKDFPFKNACKVVYPLLAPAIINLASRLSTVLVRNDKVVEVKVSGNKARQKATQVVNQQVQQSAVAAAAQDSGQPPPPPGQVVSQSATQDDPVILRGERISEFMSWERLIESPTWVLDMHKVCTIVSSWGVGFTKTYRDFIADVNVIEPLHPRDVIINNNVSSLDKANRITVRNYYNKNDIIERINTGLFNSDLDVDKLNANNNEVKENELDDDQPVYEVLEQYCFADLDDDGYYEPWIAMVHYDSKTLLGMYPAFDLQDIDHDDGKITRIRRSSYVVDFHCVDDPNGGFYSIGLNYLLVNHNKSITSILRQLIDSGTLANQQGGFISRDFRPQEDTLKFVMGRFQYVSIPSGTKMEDHIKELPFKEPSQVLLSLLEVMTQSGEKLGFISDVLTGDMEVQNVPATTMMAVVQNSTRSFKPMVQKLFCSLKKQFKLLYVLNFKHLSKQKYSSFFQDPTVNPEVDFNPHDIDISPVADPTLASDAEKFVRLGALLQTIQVAPNAANVPEILKTYYKEIGFDNPERYVVQPQPPAPPPPEPMSEKDQAQLQLDAQDQQHRQKLAEDKQRIAEDKQQLAGAKLQLQMEKEFNEKRNKQRELGIKEYLAIGQVQTQAAQLTEQALENRRQAALSTHEIGVKHLKLQQDERQNDEENRIRTMEATAPNPGRSPNPG